MPLPLILAGPILRRVEPRLVTVWMALRESADVTLSVWDNIANGGAGDGLFSGPPPDFTSAPSPTLRVCANLHISLVTLEILAPELLLPAHIHSYNLTISTAAVTHDLKSLGLLRANMFDRSGEPITEGGHLHASLGYGTGNLPSFAMPPPELTELRLLHYSCRRPHERGRDALSFVDRLIEDKLQNASERPHLLFMTGDQIYADDVAMPLLPILTEIGQELQGSIQEKMADPMLTSEFEISQENFPAGFRGKYLQAAAGFTTGSSSHLASFGEFAAMYLAVWNNVLWPTPEPDGSFSVVKFSLFEDLLARIEPTTDQLIPTWRELFRVPDSLGLTAGEHELFIKHFFITLPRDTLLQFLDKSEKRFDADTLGKQQLPLVTGDELARYQLTYNFAGSMSDDRLKRFKKVVKWLQGLFSGKQDASEIQLDHIKLLYETLPEVRRAMANVPCYMMWDDHDVTDDWYLTRDWRDNVLTKDAGVTVLRNGMVAGALFQLWGNDPKSFLPDPDEANHPNSKRAEFLREVQKLYPDGASEVSKPAVNAVSTLLGLDGTEPPPLKWHFSVDGPRYRALFLDTRTRRTFLSRFTPPGLLSDSAMEEQIPEGPLPSGLGMLFVVSPVPVLGPPVDEEIARPLGVRYYDMKAALDNKRPEGQIKMDMEWWSASPVTFEKLLARLEAYKKVIFLSGDVHHGLGAELDYWKQGETQPARFLQFTASPAKNILPAKRVVPIVGSFAFAQRILRLGISIERIAWDESEPNPVSVSGGQLPSPRLRALLRREPVLIPSHPWPDGTSATRPADWSWRFDLLSDDRPDGERPSPVQPKELPPDFDGLPRLEQYKELMERHLDYVRKNNFGRVFVFSNHIGMVRLAETPEGLEARHELHSIHPDQSPSGKPLVYTIHKGLIGPTAEAPPELPP